MSFLRRAMDYLGLSGDDAYEDYDMSTEYDRPVRSPRGTPGGGTGGYGRYPDQPDPRAPQPRGGWEPEYSSETSRPAPRPMRMDDTGAARRPDDSGIQVRPVGAPRQSSTVRTIPGPSETVTVRPRTFNHAQEIADNFKAGYPVIINLEGVEADINRRIIDFASGLCYALDGSMEKVGSGVFLLKPASHRGV